MLKKYFQIILLTALIAVPRVMAQESADAGSENEEQRRLLELVEKYTDLATKTRMNADFVPGMISVLYGDDLEARGVRTVGEAMRLVPGMNISLSSQGVWKTLVRGIPKPFASGHVKILLNGIALTTASGVNPVPDMPLAQVERIEVIRGPGSAIHGEFACAGVMNIITRKKNTRIFGAIESHDSRSGGLMISRELPEKDFLLSLSIAGAKTRYKESSGIPPLTAMPPILSALPDLSSDMVADGENSAGSEKWTDSRPEWAVSSEEQNPETVSEKFADKGYSGTGEQKKDYGSGLLNIAFKDFFFLSHWLESRQGDFSYGEIAPTDDGEKVYRTRLWGGTLGKGMNFFPGLDADFSVGWQKQEFETDDEDFYPPDSLSDSDLYGIRYSEMLIYGGIELKWKGWDRHSLFAEWSFAQTALESQRLKIAGDHAEYNDSFSEALEDFEKERWLNSLTLQDEFELNERLMLTGGLRWDHYDDAGDHISPRIAAVYRLNKRRNATHRHILKAQYARAFRPPTFLEIAAEDSGKESETADTYELAYIYRRFGAAARIMLFYSDIDARIADSRFQPEPTRFSSRGAELEAEVPLFDNKLKLDGNLSYTHSKNQESGEKIADASEWLANAGLIYQPLNRLAFGIQYRYTGGSPDAEAYHTADFTMTVFDLCIKGLTLRAGVKNIFEANLSPSAEADIADYSITNTAFSVRDSENSGSERRWWLKISYQF